MKLYLIIVLFLAFSSLCFGQAPSSSPTPTQSIESGEQSIKVNTLLVNIPVIASDKDGRYISGLTKDNFVILEDGEKQPIAFFADEKTSMNVAILIDTSGSTSSFLSNIKGSAKDFTKTLRPEDQGIIATFDFRTLFLCDPTSDIQILNEAINHASIISINDLMKFYGRSQSNMQDALYQLVTEKFASIKGRKAIIVLTDGIVKGSISNEKLLSVLAESNVIVYPILFRGSVAKGLNKDQMQFMNSLADVSGGRLYKNNSSDFKKVFQAIADELKTQYLIGFYPQNFEDGKDHKISVGVNSKDIIIRTKGVIQLKPAN